MRMLVKFAIALLLCLGFSAAAHASNTFPGTTIAGATGTFSGTNVGATGQTGEPTTYGGGALNSMWYSWTAPSTGLFSFQTCGAASTSFDTTLQVFTGAAVNTLSAAIATNDDAAGCPVAGPSDWGSNITFNAVSGTVYRIQVDGWQNATGTFLLRWGVASFTVTKTPSVASISAIGTITYSIVVANTGNTYLTSLTISDALLLGAAARTLTTGPTFVSGDTTVTNSIDPGETWTYTATYAVTQADFDATGNFSNTATYDSLQTPALTSAAAVTTVTRTASFTNVKAQSSGPSPVTAVGQTITYSITIDSTGNQTLTGPTFTDTFLLGAISRTLTTGPSLTGGDTDSDGTIDPPEIWVYTATYVTTQADFDATGSFTNAISYDTVQTAPLVSNTVTTNITRTPSLMITKSWAFAVAGDDIDGDGRADLNDKITYTYAVKNTGNVTTSGITINDTHLGAGTPPVPDDEFLSIDVAPTGTSTDAIASNSIWSILAPGDTVSFRGTYIATQTDINNQ